MRYEKLITAVFAGAMLICVTQAQAPLQSAEPAPKKYHPLLEIDIRKFGYVRFDGKNSRPMPIFVDFTDVGHLAVAWLTHDEPTAGAENGSSGEPAHLHVVVADAKTGRKQAQEKWPVPYDPIPLLFGIPDGKVLTCTANSLRLLAPTLEIVRDQELPDHNACRNFTFQRSPSKRTLLLSTRSRTSRHMELLDLQTFRSLASWVEEQVTDIHISDHWLIGSCGEPAKFCLREVGEVWFPFRPSGSEVQMSRWQRNPAAFVSDDRIAIDGDGMTVTTVKGAVLFEVKPPKGHLFFLPVSDAGGERFAVVEGRFRGLRSEPLDMYPFVADDRVLVYSITNRRLVYSMKLKGTSPWTPWDVHENKIALSPDGMLLAVLSDGVLRVYRLPIG